MYNSSNDNLPANGRGHQHPTASSYAHRVHGSLTTRVSKIICAVFLFILFALGLAAFILWLSLRPHRPSSRIEDFQLPALTHHHPNGFPNAQVIFNVTLHNPNGRIVIHYNSIQAKVLYRHQTIGTMVLVTDSFDQEPEHTIVLLGWLDKLSVNSQRWHGLMKLNRLAGKLLFRIDIKSVIKYKVFGRYSKKHKMFAHCDVMVGKDGSILAISKDKKCALHFH